MDANILIDANIRIDVCKYIDGCKYLDGIPLGQHPARKTQNPPAVHFFNVQLFKPFLTSSMLQLFALAKFCLMAAMKEWWLKKPDSQKEVGRPACKTPINTKYAGQAQKHSDYPKKGSE